MIFDNVCQPYIRMSVPEVGDRGTCPPQVFEKHNLSPLQVLTREKTNYLKIINMLRLLLKFWL